jgi:hypothetical protein
MGLSVLRLVGGQYTPRNQTLALQWQGAQVRIQGPRTRDFFMAFAKGSATGIKANGEDILSVEVILPPSPPPAASGDKGKKRPDE